MEASTAGLDAEALQASWDAQQAGYLADREERLSTMVDLVEALVGPAPAVLDLAGGTGSITRRLLARLEGATSVVLDVDPVLLAIARATFAGDRRVRICPADLADAGWKAALGEPGEGPVRFDAVLSATALHWLEPERVADLYGEIRDVLRPGGILANADHMADPGLPGTTATLVSWREERATARRRQTGAPSWEEWWAARRLDPALAGAFALRDRRFPPEDPASHRRWTPGADWHVGALRAAGFAEAGLAWRGLDDALVVGVAPSPGRAGGPLVESA